METVGLLIVLLAAVALFRLVARSMGDFREPVSMSDKEILSAIAGQADWLERQLQHVMKFGGVALHSKRADRRREYIVSLCEQLISRHPQPINLLHHATKRAKQLEIEGLPRKVAVVQAVKQRLFAENGYTYLARWHPTEED
jgi:hypothetical protein